MSPVLSKKRRKSSPQHHQRHEKSSIKQHESRSISRNTNKKRDLDETPRSRSPPRSRYSRSRDRILSGRSHHREDKKHEESNRRSKSLEKQRRNKTPPEYHRSRRHNTPSLSPTTNKRTSRRSRSRSRRSPPPPRNQDKSSPEPKRYRSRSRSRNDRNKKKEKIKSGTPEPRKIVEDKRYENRRKIDDRSPKSDSKDKVQKKSPSIEQCRSHEEKSKDRYRSNEEKPSDKRSLTPKPRSPVQSRKNRSTSSNSDAEQPKRRETKVKGNEKSSKKALPVVRLMSSSEDEASDEDITRESVEEDKEMRMLRLLKSGLAAKAKESLQRKMPAKNQQIVETQPRLSSNEEVIVEKKSIEPDVFDIKVLPTVVVRKDKSPPRPVDKDDFDISNTNGKSRSVSLSKSRSRSKSRKSRSGSSSRSSSR